MYFVLGLMHKPALHPQWVHIPTMTIETTREFAPPTKIRQWKFWATTLWVAASAVTFIVAGMAVALIVGAFPDSDHFGELKSHLGTKAAGWLIPWALGFGVLALAIRLSGIGMREYLGLIQPRPRDIGIGLAGLVVLLLALALVLQLIENRPPPYALNQYREMRADGSLLVLLFWSVVVAPPVEELFFRGFLYRGWAASRIGPAGAVVLTSAAWTAGHMQYSWPSMAFIFGVGLLYGSIRAWSGSTTATMVLHFIQNACAIGYFLISDALGLLAEA
jgi:uncharacterized protein